MITSNFMAKVRLYFDELNYRETKRFDFDAFEQAAVDTIFRCKGLDDAAFATSMYRFCKKKRRKIEKMFERKLEEFNAFDYEGNSLLSLLPSNDDFGGVFYVTNGISGKVNEISFLERSDQVETFACDSSNGRFKIFIDGKYYMRYSKWSSVKMKLFNLADERLCDIGYGGGDDVFLKNNLTDYELVEYDGFIGVYERAYFDSLSDTDTIDSNKRIADIEWGMIDKKLSLGVARLTVYEPNRDLEMMLFFAASTFLLFQKHVRFQKILRASSNAVIVNTYNSWR